jgi:hypothetical protein
MIIVAGIVESIASRRDKTAKLTIGTQELTPEQAGQIYGLNQSFVYLAIKTELFTRDELSDISELKTEFENIKTPSQRLRAILFVNYQQNPEGFQSFPNYYQSKMDQICEHFKNKLT